MKNYKISIVIPAFNIDKYLSSTLDSVLSQTYNNLEIIIINDGSTDGTKSVIDDYAKADKRIVSIHKENGGVSSARNKGIEIATGDYIGFVDGDDYVEPNMFEILINNAVQYDADISHCGMQMVFPSRVDYYYNTNEKFLQDNKKGLYDLLESKKIEPSICNKLYKSKIIKNISIKKNLKINEDVLFNYLAFKNATTSFYSDISLYHYQARLNSAASSKINKYKIENPIEIAEIIMNDVASVDKSLHLLAQKRYICANVSAFIAIVDSKNKELQKRYLTLISKNLKRYNYSHEVILPKKQKLIYKLINISVALAKNFLKILRLVVKKSDKYEVK